jgi:hypothetical protein
MIVCVFFFSLESATNEEGREQTKLEGRRKQRFVEKGKTFRLVFSRIKIMLATRTMGE